MARPTKPKYESTGGRSVQELMEALRDGRLSDRESLTGAELDRLMDSGLLTAEELETLHDLVKGPERVD